MLTSIHGSVSLVCICQVNGTEICGINTRKMIDLDDKKVEECRKRNQASCTIHVVPYVFLSIRS